MCEPISIIAGVTAVVGFIQANKAGKEAKRSRQSQAAQLARQNDLNERRVVMAEEEYERFKEIYGPAEFELSEIVRQEGLPARYAKQYAEEAAGTVRAKFGQAAGIKRRELSRYGLEGAAPGSQAYEAQQTTTNIARASAEAEATTGGRQRGQEYGEGLEFSRRMDFVSLGKGIPGTAMASMGAAASQAGNIASAYGQRALTSSRAAGSALGVAAEFGLEAVNAYQNRPRRPPTPGAGSGYSVNTNMELANTGSF